MIRTHGAGTLRATDAGQSCVLAGWVGRRRDHGGVAFVDLRDASGVAQVVIRDEILEASGAHDLRNEFCIAVTGVVELRPEGNANPDLPTGEIEVAATAIEVLNSSGPLPFQIDERVTVGEEARLKYRYLDLRRPAPAHALRLRSRVNQVARNLLVERDFVEIETPTLTRSTPEGARDFLVPARLKPGSWYALPQSPQLFKQLLMVAGMERYFQIARCYRDEDFRADRQPEFTQLDIEMSFVDQDDIIALTEDLIAAIWLLIGYQVAATFPRITYAESMERYGSDKPDLRFETEITDLTAYFADTAVPGVPGRVRRCGGDARRGRPAPAHLRRLAGVRQAARPPRPRLRHGRRGRHPRRSGGQEPVGHRAGRSGRRGRRRSRGTACSSPRVRAGAPRRCSARPGWRWAAAAA